MRKFDVAKITTSCQHLYSATFTTDDALITIDLMTETPNLESVRERMQELISDECLFRTENYKGIIPNTWQTKIEKDEND